MKISRSAGSGSRYSYSYSRNEIPLEGTTDLIGFELIDVASLGVHQAYIHGHVCSRPSAIERTHSGIGATPIVPSNDNGKQLDEGTTFVCFRHTISALELIHIGLIIVIQETPHSRPEFLLCDPQVGNGPPSPGGGGFRHDLPDHERFIPYSLPRHSPYLALKLK